MIDVKTNPIALTILGELKDELISKDKAYEKAINSIVKATQTSLQDESDTEKANIKLCFDQEPFRGLLWDLMHNVVEAEKLESEHEMACKRRKLSFDRLKLEVEELFDLDDIRISHALGAVIKLTEEEIKHKKDAARENHQFIVDSVRILLGTNEGELKAFCEGQTSEKLKELRDDRLEPFFVDMAEFLVKNGNDGHNTVAGVVENEEILEKILVSERAPKPLSFLAEIVKGLKKTA